MQIPDPGDPYNPMYPGMSARWHKEVPGLQGCHFIHSFIFFKLLVHMRSARDGPEIVILLFNHRAGTT